MTEIYNTTIKKGSKLSISNGKLQDHFKEHIAAKVPELEMPPVQPDQVRHLNDIEVEVVKDPPTAEEI